MRIIGRNDLVLIAGLTSALFVIFSKSLARLLDYIEEIEESRGLRLLPALVILATVFIFHQLRKRQEIRAQAESAAAEARQATARVVDMERLVAFGHALARSLDEDSIRQASIEHIPSLAPDRDAWVMVCAGGEWRSLVTFGGSRPVDRERAAQHALADIGPGGGPGDADITFPMMVAGTAVGVLGVAPQPRLTEHQRSGLTAAAALLAVSLKNAELFREVHENSVRDGLTGCFTRRHAFQVITAELQRARRSEMPLSLVMFDLDHFKTINDRYGHLAGDAVLSELGQRMNAVLRSSDLKCRYGGEEFVLLLPDTPLAGAQRVAETLRREIADRGFAWDGGSIGVTASFGVTGITPGEADPLVIMARADGALYRAKLDGRNCVRGAEVHPAIASS